MNHDSDAMTHSLKYASIVPNLQCMVDNDNMLFVPGKYSLLPYSCSPISCQVRSIALGEHINFDAISL